MGSESYSQNIWPTCVGCKTGWGTMILSSFAIDIVGGDINLSNLNGYRIETGACSPYVLWHNGIISSIYLEVGAGNANTTKENIFLGYGTGAKSGFTSTTCINGSLNTFAGFLAGNNNVEGYVNCF